MSSTDDRSERDPLLAKPKAEDAYNPANFSARRKWCILVALWLGVFLGAADSTCVATILSPISSSFNASNQSSWIATSYLLTLACFTPIYGRFSDIAGRRAAFLLGLSLFFIGTLGSGLANSLPVFIASRLVAGMGAGGIMSISSCVATDLTKLQDRGYIQGIANLFYGLGAGIGAPIAGLISDTLGWRIAFLIQLPVIALSFALVSWLVTYRVSTQAAEGSSRKEMFKRIDYLGSGSLIVSIGGLLIGLSFKTNEQRSWGDVTVAVPLALFVVFLLLFLLVEARVSREPIMPMRLLTARSPVCILIGNFLCSAVGYSILYNYPMWFEAVRLQSSAQAGYHLIPNSVALSVGSLGIGLVIRRTGRYYYPTLFSAAITIPSLITFMLTTERSSRFVQWAAIIPSGVGIGAGTTSLLVALISAISKEDMATATATSYLFRYTGQVTGVSLSSAVLQGTLGAQLKKRITGPGAMEIIKKIRHKAEIVRDLSPELKREAVASYSTALRAVFGFNLVLAVVLVLCVLPIREYSLKQAEDKNDQEE